MNIFTESLNRRKDRAIAIIMTQKERDCDQYLPPEVSRKFRKVILDQINDLHEFASDMLKSSEYGMMNQEYFDRLEKLMSTLEEKVSDG